VSVVTTPPADYDLRVKLAIYALTAGTGRVPDAVEVERRVGGTAAEVREAFARLAARRLLVLEPDGVTIRMAPPFSAVPTQHVVASAGVEYHANCAWDAFGIVAALGREGEVRSRCEQSGQPLRLRLDAGGPGESDWRFHCLVPAAQWWSDIVFT
jgi:hypothetical protein